MRDLLRPRQFFNAGEERYRFDMRPILRQAMRRNSLGPAIPDPVGFDPAFKSGVRAFRSRPV